MTASFVNGLHFSAARAAFFLTALAGISAPSTAAAHTAPTGWAYPYNCCSNQDCRAVSDDNITERPEGYVIGQTGEVLGYTDSRLKDSPDGEYHWCSTAGSDTGRTICLFVPPRSF